MFFTSLLLAVAGAVVYHLAIKQVPQDANPFFALAISYGAALMFCLIGLWWFPGGQRGVSALNWSSLGVALGIFGIEIGFLLAYRAGWNVGYAALSVNVLTAAILLPLGWWLFSEQPSAGRLAGVGLSMAGLWMMLKFR
ncbi:EamA family transporter [Chromobacterium sp. IIBBL 290-4]|uniref:EamA family transporter n=1 Tax=Chromobacterium sp. IIBBL 290-4 TaxID=2953890 RepID=UPI0020B76E55|nr:EamA family transporter [Chromobacterium sp. IIBBL 290-4]UTH75891.1 EamA family transporter [Chromobacterium sp. IIBBL 290-4]